MKKFRVIKEQTIYYAIEVEAEDYWEAVKKADKIDGDLWSVKKADKIDGDLWSVTDLETGENWIF